ncbi:MAG: aldolase/citrate lyase family protein [Burkholderiales bacterium]|nr:aldolase/citrate lyase family protein [Burkholderiales bacterium]
MTTDFATRLRRGETLLGTVVTLPALEVPELLSAAGFDWLFVDCEHAPLDFLAAQSLLQAARVPCVVRVPDGHEATLKKALDIGAAGVVVPMVTSAQQARAVVSFCKYPPQGTRGVGIVRAQGYGAAFQAYVARANETTTVIVQVEHISAIENIDAIVAVPGVDAVFVGPYDLSGSMDRMGEVEHIDVLAAIEGVRLACERARMPLGIYVGSAAAAKQYLQKGFTLVAVGIDALLLAQAGRQIVQSLR